MAKKKTSSLDKNPVFLRLKRMLSDPETVRDVIWEHEVGQLVDRLCPRGKRAYGQGKIQQLAVELGQGLTLANKLWNARKLGVALTRDELVDLNREAKRTNFKLTASHVLSLVTINEAQDLAHWAARCIEQKWTVKQLRREIHRVQGKRSHGRAPVVGLPSPADALDDLEERTRSWLARYDQAWFGSTEAKLSTLPELLVTDEKSKERLKEIEDLLLVLRKSAANARTQLRQRRLEDNGS